VYETKPRPRSMLMVLSALLFFAPEVHLKGIETSSMQNVALTLRLRLGRHLHGYGDMPTYVSRCSLHVF
jgi:hypothetical protein